MCTSGILPCQRVAQGSPWWPQTRYTSPHVTCLALGLDFPIHRLCSQLQSKVEPLRAEGSGHVLSSTLNVSEQNPQPPSHEFFIHKKRVKNTLGVLLGWCVGKYFQNCTHGVTTQITQIWIHHLHRCCHLIHVWSLDKHFSLHVPQR